jgi:uncharacterized protein (DUF2141 family)
MKIVVVTPIIAFILLGAGPVKPTASLGKAQAACRVNETGPALLITAVGLKDRKGLLRAELYPNNDKDFLEDDAILINAGKTFRRVDLALTASNDPTLCMRVPSAGKYTLSLLHDRDRNLKFGFTSDGIGFSNNPKLARSKPKASAATITASSGITRISIRMYYRNGLISFGPIQSK